MRTLGLVRISAQSGCFSLASSLRDARIQFCPERPNAPRELIGFVGASASVRRNEGKERKLAIGIREDIIMLDKAPNGKVSDLLNALDKALSAGEVEHAVDLFQTDCYW